MATDVNTRPACLQPGCLIRETGICVLNKVPSVCEFYSSNKSALNKPLSPQISAETTSGFPTDPASNVEAQSPEIAKTFHSGRELGRSDTFALSAAQYAKLIGIFGRSESGKTTFLNSLYLHAMHALMPNNYFFRGSLTLQAFEERLRLLRDWDNASYEEFPVDHTRMGDPHHPALLHLNLSRDGVSHHLLLTDYPGEWTERVAESRPFAEKLSFLKNAHGFIFVLDGPLFLNNNERHAEAETMRMVIDRLTNDVSVIPEVTPFVILVTKGDLIEMAIPESAQQVADYAISAGFPTKVVSAASFSSNLKSYKHGTGIFEALEFLLTSKPTGLRESNKATNTGCRRIFHQFKT